MERKKEFGERDVVFKQKNIVLLVVGQPSQSTREGLPIHFLPLQNLMGASVLFAPPFPLWPGLLLFLWYSPDRLPFGDHLYHKSGTVCSPGSVNIPPVSVSCWILNCSCWFPPVPRCFRKFPLVGYTWLPAVWPFFVHPVIPTPG